MDTWIKICGGALLCVVAIVVLRQIGRDGALPLQWTGGVLLSAACVVLLQPILSFATELAAQSGVGEMASLLLRGLGVAFVTQLCADFCRQSGEGAIASGVENAGRIELLLMALTPMKTLLEMARELLDFV